MLSRAATGCDRPAALHSSVPAAGCPTERHCPVSSLSETATSPTAARRTVPQAPDTPRDPPAAHARDARALDDTRAPDDSRPADAVSARQRRRGRLAFVAKALVSLGLIWVLLRGQDPAALAAMLTRLPGWSAVAALAVILVMIGLITQRWRLISAGLGAPQPGGFALRLSFIGQFFSQGLPTSFGGDAMRVWILYRRGNGLGTATQSVLLDRMTALVALLLMVGATLPLVAGVTDDRLVLMSLGGLVATGLGGLAVFLCLDRVPARWLGWKPAAQLARLSGQARLLLLTPASAVRVIGLSVLGHLGSVLALWVLARGLGLNLPLVAALCLVPPVILATALPVSIAGWGIREGAMVGVLGLIGISAEAALAVSVLFGLGLVITALPGAVCWLIDRGGRSQAATG